MRPFDGCPVEPASLLWILVGLPVSGRGLAPPPWVRKLLAVGRHRGAGSEVIGSPSSPATVARELGYWNPFRVCGGGRDKTLYSLRSWVIGESEVVSARWGRRQAMRSHAKHYVITMHFIATLFARVSKRIAPNKLRLNQQHCTSSIY